MRKQRVKHPLSRTQGLHLSWSVCTRLDSRLLEIMEYPSYTASLLDGLNVRDD